MLLRYLLVHWRNPVRLIEIIFWPLMDLLVWGFVTRYLDQFELSVSMRFMIGGMILWDVFFRAQQAMTLSLMQEIWTGNILNLYCTPLRTAELMTATALFGLTRSLLTTVLLALLAALFYDFNLFSLAGVMLPALFALLMLFGWSMGLLTSALILRYGEGVEHLIWAVPFLIQPFTAVFYPISVLPTWVQPIAHVIPVSHVFEAMRQVLQGAPVSSYNLAMALGLTVLYLAGGAYVLGRMMRFVREEGYLTRLNRN